MICGDEGRLNGWTNNIQLAKRNFVFAPLYVAFVGGKMINFIETLVEKCNDPCDDFCDGTQYSTRRIYLVNIRANRTQWHE